MAMQEPFYLEGVRIMNFHCVSVEFYDCGKVLACVTESERKKKPNQQFRRVHGLTAFKIWLSDETIASQLIAGIESGKFDVDDVLYFYSDLNEHDYQQKKAA
jgi:hypothetical protein